MFELDIPPDFLRDLILKVRAVMVKEAPHMSDEGGRASDDDDSAVLEGMPGDLRDEEVFEELESLDDDHKHELVALMWLGRGDGDVDDWEDLLQLAEERHSGPVAEYLLSHPLLADYWLEGLDKLYDGTDLLESGEY